MSGLEPVDVAQESFASGVEGDGAAHSVPRRRREHFIPLRDSELARLLADEPGLIGEQRELFRQWCSLVDATIHHKYHEELERLKDLYAPFDPDSVTTEAHPLADAERDRVIPELFERCLNLLERANYRRLTRHEIEQASHAASEWGVNLRVDFTAFERLEVCARGDVVDQRTRRRWVKLCRPEHVQVPIYQRLVVLFRMRQHQSLDKCVDTGAVYFKIFKNIPKQDLDMLLPATQFRMTLLDRGKIMLPTLSGVVIAAVKIVKGAVFLAFAGFYGVLGLLGLVGGTVGYGIRSFLGYLRTKDKYQLSLTRHLYYQNLDNNAGVLCRVLDEAEEQEFSEAALAYAILHGRAGSEGWTSQQLDRAAEAYLSKWLGFPVDFEVRDALDKLARMGSAERADGGRWRAVPLRAAILRLDRDWDDCFRPGIPTRAESDRPPELRPPG